MRDAAVLEPAGAPEPSSTEAAATRTEAAATPPGRPAPVEVTAVDGATAALPESRSVEHLLPLVQSIARMVSHTLPPVVELDDLVHDGVVGLLECARRFDPGRGVDFRTYAAYRIRGAIFDGLRVRDPLPRSVRRAIKAAGRDAAGEGASQRRPVETPRVLTTLVSLEDATALAEDGTEPEERLLALELGQTLRRAVSGLSPRDREVLYFRFTRGWRLREVAAHYGISITRVAEVQDRAILRLRRALDVPRPAELSPNGRRKRRRGR